MTLTELRLPVQAQGRMGIYCDDATDGYIDSLIDGTCTWDGCVPAGCQTTQGDDCDDDNRDIYPGAPEVCNGMDDDCNMLIDDGLPQYTYYRDADSDTYGNPYDTTQTCLSAPPSGYVTDNTDCDDGNAAVNPGETEGPYGDTTCSDSWDNDCDGLADSADRECQAVSGCIDLGGSPIANKKVVFKQIGEIIQARMTDSGGCYGFVDAVSGKAFTVQINGPVLKSPVPVIHGCADLQGSPMSGRKALLKQKNELNKSTKTGADGCYSFTNAVPDKNFKVLIKGPVVP